MADYIKQTTPMPYPDRPIKVNDHEYLATTTETCTTCAADTRMMYVKAHLQGGTSILECPFCLNTLAVKSDTLNG